MPLRTVSVPATPLRRVTSSDELAAKLLQVQPRQMQFEWSSNADMHSHFALRNISSQQVAFKIRTTAPETYKLRVSTGILEPGDTAFIKVVKKGTSTMSEAADVEGHYFVVQAVGIDFKAASRLDADLLSATSSAVAKVKVKVVARAKAAWPNNAAEFERLAEEVENRLREAIIVDGPARQKDMLQQFGVLLLTKGLMSMQQFNGLKTIVRQLCDATQLEEFYWRKHSKQRHRDKGTRSVPSSRAPRSPQLAAAKAPSAFTGDTAFDAFGEAPRPSEVISRQGSLTATQRRHTASMGSTTSASSLNSAKGKAHLIEQYLRADSSQGASPRSHELLTEEFSSPRAVIGSLDNPEDYEQADRAYTEQTDRTASKSDIGQMDKVSRTADEAEQISAGSATKDWGCSGQDLPAAEGVESHVDAVASISDHSRSSTQPNDSAAAHPLSEMIQQASDLPAQGEWVQLHSGEHPRLAAVLESGSHKLDEQHYSNGESEYQLSVASELCAPGSAQSQGDSSPNTVCKQVLLAQEEGTRVAAVQHTCDTVAPAASLAGRLQQHDTAESSGVTHSQSPSIDAADHRDWQQQHDSTHLGVQHRYEHGLLDMQPHDQEQHGAAREASDNPVTHLKAPQAVHTRRLTRLTGLTDSEEDEEETDTNTDTDDDDENEVQQFRGDLSWGRWPVDETARHAAAACYPEVEDDGDYGGNLADLPAGQPLCEPDTARPTVPLPKTMSTFLPEAACGPAVRPGNGPVTGNMSMPPVGQTDVDLTRPYQLREYWVQKEQQNLSRPTPGKYSWHHGYVEPSRATPRAAAVLAAEQALAENVRVGGWRRIFGSR